MTIRLPVELSLKLRHFAVDARVSINDVIVAALRQFMSAQPNPKDFPPLKKASASSGVERKSR